MQRRQSTLTATRNYDLVNVSGKQWLLYNISDKSARVNIEWYNSVGATIATFEDIPQKLNYRPPEGFSSFKIDSNKPVVVQYLITDGTGTFDIPVDLSGQTISVANDATNPLYIGNPPGQSLSTDIQNWPSTLTQPNGCEDALRVSICGSEAIELKISHDQGGIDDITTMIRPFNAARQWWGLKNVSAQDVLIAIGGAGLDATNAVRVVKTGDVWIEDDPKQAAQAIHIRTVPYSNSAIPLNPNGVNATYTFEERA